MLFFCYRDYVCFCRNISAISAEVTPGLLVGHFDPAEQQLSGGDVLCGSVRLLAGHPVQAVVVVTAVRAQQVRQHQQHVLPVQPGGRWSRRPRNLEKMDGNNAIIGR